MPQPRAADYFEIIRSRLEELRRERQLEQSAPISDAGIPGHRGRCAGGMSLFLDECDGSCKAL